MANIIDLLEKNEKAISQTEEGLKGIKETYPRRYALHSEKQDQLIGLLRTRCDLLARFLP